MPEIPCLAPHNNHPLFFDHYLNYTLSRRADWAALREAAGLVRAEIAALLAAFTPGTLRPSSPARPP